MAELTKEEALSKYSLLQELLETEDYERLDPEGEYPGEEEEVEDALSDLRSWARKQALVFAWQNDAWALVPADEDTKATWKARRWIHRNAGLIGNFMLQDKAAEGQSDPASVDDTSIVGVLPRHAEDEPRTWLVHVQATADSGFGYSYPVDLYLTISGTEEQPHVAEATDEQVKQLTQESEASNG